MMPSAFDSWTIGQLASMACLLECIAPKPGNVHRGADFEDLTLLDFATSAVGFGASIDRFVEQKIGKMILGCVQHTQQLVGTNTNLGISLLLVPIAKAALSGPVNQASIAEVLSQLDSDDASSVYAAIQMSGAGSLGKSKEHDLKGKPPQDLVEAMRFSMETDFVARQYANGFADLFATIIPELHHRIQTTTTTQAIVATHLFVMAKFPDSLIGRKCGIKIAEQSAIMADRVLQVFETDVEQYERRIGELDFWLRSDGHRRNPGTTADLICAAIFVLLIKGDLKPRFT